MKACARHTRYAGRQRDEGANHRKKAAEEYRQISPTAEEAVGPIEFALAHENPAAVALDQGASAVAADFVGDQRPQIAPYRTHRRAPEQAELALKHEVSGKGHD